MLSIGCVDNRFIAFSNSLTSHPAIQVLAQDDFYDDPVELEVVTNWEPGFMSTAQKGPVFTNNLLDGKSVVLHQLAALDVEDS